MLFLYNSNNTIWCTKE